MNLWCNSHRICLCISNKWISVRVTVYESQNLPLHFKQIFSVTVTELDFVFYNKTVKDISKNVKNKLTLKKIFAPVSSLYSYF